MFKNPYRLLVDSIKGNIYYQSIFERLCQSIFLAMNCGTGGSIYTSGEIYALKFIKNKIKESPNKPVVIFDVGANVGEYTSYIINIFEEKFKVFAFEPSKETYNIMLNKIKNENVEIYNFGLGDLNREIFLFSDFNSGSTIASIYSSSLDRWVIDLKKEEIINIKKIDEFCLEKEIKYIHLLKIDVEGHELKVLEGAERMIDSNAIQYIQFEFGPCNLDSRSYFKDFFNLLHKKYKIYRIVKNGLYPIERYKEMYEIFYVTNYLAEHK